MAEGPPPVGRGYGGQHVLDMLRGVVGEEVFGLLHGPAAYDDIELDRAPAGLHESWYEQADEARTAAVTSLRVV